MITHTTLHEATNASTSMQLRDNRTYEEVLACWRYHGVTCSYAHIKKKKKGGGNNKNNNKQTASKHANEEMN